MYAVIETGGKQVRVQNGSQLKVELLDAEAGSEVEFRNVLLVTTGEETRIGTPYVENAVVKADVLENGKDKKILVFKKLPRKGFKRLRGHRQPYTLVKIKEISYGG